MKYQVCRLITNLKLKGDVWTENINLSVYLKPGKSRKIDNVGKKQDERWQWLTFRWYSISSLYRKSRAQRQLCIGLLMVRKGAPESWFSVLLKAQVKVIGWEEGKWMESRIWAEKKCIKVISENRKASLIKKLEKHSRITGSTKSTFEVWDHI